MQEVNGDANSHGAGDYKPRHAALPPDAEFLEAMATAADQYVYSQMEKEIEARYAIERTRLSTGGETSEDKTFIGNQEILVAKAIGRQAVAKEYAASLREQIQSVSSSGVQYHGRHRLEDQPQKDRPPPKELESVVEKKEEKEKERIGEPPPVPPKAPPPKPVAARPPQPTRLSAAPPAPPQRPAAVPPLPDDSSAPLPVPPRPSAPSLRPRRLPASVPPAATGSPESPYGAPAQGKSRYADSDEWLPTMLYPLLEDFPDEEETETPRTPEQKHKLRLLQKMRRAYYARKAAAKAYFTDPEKIHRRQVITRVAKYVGAAIAVGLAVWLGPHLSHNQSSPPYVAQPAGPPPNTEQFFDTINPGSSYHGEQFEWSAAANNTGPAQATPQLQRLITNARDGGLGVDTWGNPARGDWGIDSVTVKLPDGTHKSYYDTPRKLAILQWYAGGMGPQGG